MKFLIAVLILIVSAAMVKSIDPEEKKKMMMESIAACKASTGASDDDIAKLMLHKKPEAKEGKCMFNCFMEKMGMLKEGKMNKDGLVAWGKSMNAADDLVGKIISECEEVSDPDACESGINVGFCLKTTAMKHKLKMEF
ncbi:hypothetical protein PVAND_015143 [Polypedilum vanderplanki]|uniref:Odorant binding protein n=1 Tax=Polypedilum vanderplanki TaxID=319348 RepID=A0A9J6BBR9_POLVA|nr:hypothetical protein PVAND_015143 [Polypedilum vanderplanki]